MQPLAARKVITDVPADTPVTIPDDAPTDATDGMLAAQDSPVPSVSVLVAPMHIPALPAIAPGSALMVTFIVR
jgi:hypothetical protein